MTRRRRVPFRNESYIQVGDTVQVAAGLTLLGATGIALSDGHGEIEIDLKDWGYTTPKRVQATRLRIVKKAPQMEIN